MAGTTKHTPTPWGRGPMFARTEGADGYTVRAVVNNFPKRIAVFENEDDADYAIRACNSHDALVDYVKNTIAAIDAPYFDTKRKYAIRDAGRALLSQLEAGK